MADQTFPNVEIKKSLDLEEIFGFEEARRTAEELRRKALLEQNYVEPLFFPHRVFINNIDCYHGKYIAKFLSEQVFGGTKEVVREESAVEVMDEEEEEGSKPEKLEEPEIEPPKIYYEIIGTLKDIHYKLPEDVTRIIKFSKDDPQFIAEIMKCGFVIYDINDKLAQIKEATFTLKAIETELTKLKENAPKAFKNMPEVRCFVLISNVMTWALTRPIDPDEPGIPFTDADYRKRKPHPNFTHHADIEKEVVKVGKMFKEKLKTTVICSGITYGADEDTLEFLFRQAWLNEPELPLFLAGKNKVPMIYIQDLVSIVHNILEEFPPSSKYILAVELHVNKLKTIVKAISKALGSGRYKQVTKEEAFLIPRVTQKVFDKLTVDLNMEPSYIVENMELNWASEMTFAENIQKLATEYKDARGLKAIKLYIHGPPGVGKSLLAKRLCEHYNLHFLNAKDVISDAIEKLKDKIQQLKAKEQAAAAAEEGDEEDKEMDEDADEAEEEEENEEDEEAQESLEELEEQLDEIQKSMAENNGRLDERFVLKMLADTLAANPCQNQGYVLEKFPKTIDDAKYVYGPLEGEEDEEEEQAGEDAEEGEAGETPHKFNRKTLPDYVIHLAADDEQLIQQVSTMDELDAQGSRLAEEVLIERIKKFREINTPPDTVLDFFDEIEIHPMVIPVMEDTSPTMEATFKRIIKTVGKPTNFGPSKSDLAVKKKAELARLQAEAAEAKEYHELMIKQMEEERNMQMEEWTRVWEALQKEEEEKLALQSIPLRSYLIRYVFPTLIRGLKEVERVHPADPTDYLAEFLFRENPEGKMMQPDFNAVSEDLMRAINRLQASILDINSIHTLGDPPVVHPDNSRERALSLDD